MRVAVFTDTFLPQINGVTNTLNRLIQYFSDSDIEYRLFAPNYDSAVTNSNVERFFSLKFILYPESRIAFPNTFRISAILDRFQPDIIHVMTEFNMGVAGLNYGKKHGIPVISNYTTNFPQYMEYYNANFLKQSVWNYMKWFHNQSNLTLCPSYVAQKLLKENGIYNTGIFSRGIDIQKFNPCNRNIQLRKTLGILEKKSFLYVGRIAFEKDLDVLCEGYHLLKQKYGDLVALVLTGDGPYLDKCKQSLPEDTIFTGFKQGIELYELYASCDFFVCPSSTETFGNVILEAMASGLTVIGADAGGVGEIIQDQCTGLKFEPHNVESLFNCMEKVYQSPEFVHCISKQAQEFCDDRSWKSIFDKLTNTYGELIVSEKQQIVGVNS